MKTCALWLVLAFSCCGFGQQHHVWFGTSTSKKGPSKGIYHGVFDSAKGSLAPVTLAAEIGSPGFLELHPNGSVLYAVGSLDEGPCVAAYKVDGATLTLLNSTPIGDGGAAHIGVHPSGRFLATAQYGAGSTAVFPLDAEGRVGERSQLLEHEGGSNVVPNRQTKPHAHWVGFDPAGEYAFVPDLGLDAVVVYKVEGDRLTPHAQVAGPPGGGPRHMKFSVDGSKIFLLNELSLSVTTYDYADGTMTQKGTVPALSEAQKAEESFNSASEIRVHANGKFVYSANRGHDSISVYNVDEAGVLTLIENEPVRGAWPRNFNIDPSGKWLIAAGAYSHTAAVFAIDPISGKLTFPRGAITTVPSSICVLFGAER